jgi:Diacylglycerol kinase catalytic domain
MTRIALISNPRSQRNKKHMPAMREAAARHPDLLHVELDDVHAAAEVLRGLARRDVDLVAVSAGDGTVQKILTELLNGSGFETLPMIAVLPSGMTNLIAADVGLRGDPTRSLDRLCRIRLSGGGVHETVIRPVLSMQRTPDEPPVHGMFLGTAAFYHGIMAARDEVHPLGAKHTLAAAMALTLALFRLLTGRSGSNMLLHGERMTVELNGARSQPSDYLLFLATTLQRLILGVMPFWGEGDGLLRYTAVGFPPQGLWRALVPAMRGRPRPWMAARGYRSGRVLECRLMLDSPIVFDGEFFRPEPGVPVVLRADRHVTFLRC